MFLINLTFCVVKEEQIYLHQTWPAWFQL